MTARDLVGQLRTELGDDGLNLELTFAGAPVTSVELQPDAGNGTVEIVINTPEGGS